MGINWIGLSTMLHREAKRTMRVAIQTLVAPVISAALYIFIFGTVIGTRIDDFAGVPYIAFVFPGVLMLSIINASFASSSSALYFMRFTRGIEEILITPFSYLEMLVGFVGSAVTRALMVSFLILGVGITFGAVHLGNPLLFVFYVSAISAIFAMLGIIVALWAESFEQLQSLNTFVITPLTYLGGIFYSITFLPPLAAMITRVNPFFYFADAIRSSMIGYSEANSAIGFAVIVGLVLILAMIVTTIFKRGWKLRA
ncbi:MAG: ABC transporter permease [Candidatus Magasanikbacteria bacterium]|jgi:ABC-2 type transport system permease protein|nr:ABC transporter permease [Candidatus Magasanikbacteria bacterium]MBT4221023.1 ABC transporter permease [Candidatus Magasanikbacteria bacterium]MBT4542068.1 ABC transporter permease [Candidatus Magasanikbacteria bacterium]MBT6253572.1 ABC transporter permease [Candidatus Magasanikbacteria bacterium]MBT6334752.1 ABC transporter permease [Candidatus Magasanikbacteria bacterium]